MGIPNPYTYNENEETITLDDMVCIFSSDAIINIKQTNIDASITQHEWDHANFWKKCGLTPNIIGINALMRSHRSTDLII